MEPTRADVLAFIDVETTGLDPAVDALLEVACLVTDTDLNLLDEKGFQTELFFSEDALAHAIKPMAGRDGPYVVDMHEKTGLWDRLPLGLPTHMVEQDLLAYIKRFAPAPRQARIAGNSVCLDLDFLQVHMPAVAEHLHFRLFDISTIAFAAEKWSGVSPFPKEFRHSALDDIRESLAEARALRTTAFRDPKNPGGLGVFLARQYPFVSPASGAQIALWIEEQSVDFPDEQGAELSTLVGRLATEHAPDEQWSRKDAKLWLALS